MRPLSEILAEIEISRTQIAELEIEKKLAEKDAANPRRRRIRDRYLTIQHMIEQLDDMGERVVDAEGYALHIKGKSFEIHPETGVQEV